MITAADQVPPAWLRRWQIYYDSGVQIGLDHHPVDPTTAAQSKQTNSSRRLGAQL